MMKGTSLLARGVVRTRPSFWNTIHHAMHSTNKFDSQCAEIVACDDDSIKRCGDVIVFGGLVAFPTETVYGLGANALNATAVQSIFTAKKRPNSDPLIVHVLDKNAMIALFDFSEEPTTIARSVCESLWDAFCPGPLTIIYKAAAHVPSVVTAGTGFVGVRSPSHSIALKLLQASQGLPIAAPSANRFGHVSPTSSDHVLHDLRHADVKILRDDVQSTGGCRVGLESTVCRVQVLPDGVSATLTILRCGAVTSSMIDVALRSSGLTRISVIIDNEKHLSVKAVVGSSSSDLAASEDVIVAPGQMTRHYAPDIPTYIVSSAQDASQLDSFVEVSAAAVIDFGGRLIYLKERCARYTDLSPAGDLNEACYSLFRELRSAESQEVLSAGVTTVLLPDLRGDDRAVVGGKEWDARAQGQGLERALWERLHRAASGMFINVPMK